MPSLQHKKPWSLSLLQEMWIANLRGASYLYSQTSEVSQSFSALRFVDSEPLEIYRLLNYAKSNSQVWLPSGRSVFENYFIIPDRHLSAHEVFNIVRKTSETIRPHLIRETVTSDIVKQDNSIIAAFKVQKRLT